MNQNRFLQTLSRFVGQRLLFTEIYSFECKVHARFVQGSCKVGVVEWQT